MATSQEFDAIILDRMLPGGLDGLGVLEMLRGQANHTPVMFLSAMAHVDDRVRGLKAAVTTTSPNRSPSASCSPRVEALARRRRAAAPETRLQVARPRRWIFCPAPSAVETRRST